ncbi:tRNA (adenine(37)-N6)-methyltransferase [Leptinotarsa decemlineata]|uniref:tRNA (adenine(37)-N6)-methyltransferase n=1 Tax=Leptinotarsa decemlineata TaxID=7539 RepID=UPI003D305D1C
MSVNETGEKPLDTNLLLTQLQVARREIHNLRQQLLSFNNVHKKECEFIHQKLRDWQCSSCKANQALNEQSRASTTLPVHDFQTKYIGRITTNFPEKRGTPRQPGICNDMIAKLTLDTNYFSNPSHALEGLQEFSHLWIIFHFHKNESIYVKPKVAPPRLNGIRMGVFATRAPHRPCPIGLSLVKIDRIVDNVIYFSGVDMISETPVLDIKPYIPHYDNPGYVNADNNTYVVENFPDSPDNSGDISTSEASTSDNIEGGEVRENLNTRVLDGEENEPRDPVLGTPLPSDINLRTEETFHVRSNSTMGEREAPDGEEEEPAGNQPVTAGLSTASTPEGHIRVPPWIDQPLVPRLTVIFKERATTQLSQLGAEGEEKKTAIANVLREDPRSVYLRGRYGSHCYNFRIAELYVTCKFNDNSKSVTVYQISRNGNGDDED